MAFAIAGPVIVDGLLPIGPGGDDRHGATGTERFAKGVGVVALSAMT